VFRREECFKYQARTLRLARDLLKAHPRVRDFKGQSETI